MNLQPVSQPIAAPTSTTTRRIRKVAVLGAGIMGARIAMHFANIGVNALLLDITPSSLTPDEEKRGLTLQSPEVRNRIVKSQFEAALASKPAPLYHKDFAQRIKLGNFDDDLSRLADCDWIIEAVIERLDIKQSLFERIEKVRKPGTLITTNTSGIPMAMLAQGRSEDFRRHFCGTHFFNPPRYLQLLEIIPGPDTAAEVLDFLTHYGDVYLGKETVGCKDTPAFIANRIGIFAIMDLLHLVAKYGLSVEEVDKLTGPLIGHPKSATFRTCDVVGLDTAVKVAKGIADNCPNDERKAVFALPDYVQYMVDNQLFGDKTGKGFYQKVKTESGESQIYSINFQTKAYGAQQKVSDPLLDQLKTIESLTGRMRAIMAGSGKYADFLRDVHYGLFAYVSHRVPEIADEVHKIDAGMRAGFGWELGPFELWDAVGLKHTLPALKAAGHIVAPWVEAMYAAGCESFYRIENGIKTCYNPATQSYQAIAGTENFILLDTLRPNKTVWSNSGAAIVDIGQGVLCVEFRSKMNTLGGDVMAAINKAIDLAESGYTGVVIGNNGENFSVGANLGLVFMLAIEQEYDELDFAVRLFQNTAMRLRYSSVPVVVAPHNMTLGGGCELTLHADLAVASAETYIGLVEVGVGLLPGGGGTKEMAVRISDRYMQGDVEMNIFTQYFMTVAQAKVSTSAIEAYDLGIFRKGIDRVVVNPRRVIAEARAAVVELAHAGYTQPQPKLVRVLGKTGLGAVYAGTYQMEFAGYATAHDRLIAEKIGWVLCGGDLSTPQVVSEQYLLDMEREAFLSLLGERKTLERIQHMLKTGKPLRN